MGGDSWTREGWERGGSWALRWALRWAVGWAVGRLAASPARVGACFGVVGPFGRAQCFLRLLCVCQVVFQEVAEYMGLKLLRERLIDPSMQHSFAGLFPLDSPKNTRFAINFWTAIGLGGLTDGMRNHLKNAPKIAMQQQQQQAAADDSDSSDSDSSSSDSSDSSDSDSDSSDSSSSVRLPRPHAPSERPPWGVCPL